MNLVAIDADLDSLQTQIDAPTSGLDGLANDCLRFTMHFFHPIQQSARHIYHSALPLSPKSSIFSSMSLPEQTRISDFYGRTDYWGSVVRTIPGNFVSMTTIGRGSTAKIAVACDDGTVRIYDSVTGVLRLSLRPELSVYGVTGLPDGSLLVCMHYPTTTTITLWDIQTGGLVHTFRPEEEVFGIAVSLEGRYLACETSVDTVHFFDTTSRTRCPDPIATFRGSYPCWLAPEELVAVSGTMSVCIRSIVLDGPPERRIRLPFGFHSAVYSQVFDRLAIKCLLPVSGHPEVGESSITILDLTAVISSTPIFTGLSSQASNFDVTAATTSTFHASKLLSCIAFSQTTNELVCGWREPGLDTVGISTGRCTHFDFPATVASVSTLSNGTVVARVLDSGIHLLRLDQEHPSPRQPTPLSLPPYPLDRGRIITIVPTNNDYVILLETSTMSEVLSIPTQKILSVAADHTLALDASLDHKVAAHYFTEGDKGYLQVSEFLHRRPRWTLPTKELPSAVKFSPACTRLVTFHNGHSRSSVRVWDAYDGRRLAWMSIDDPHAPCPLDITFDSEDRFYLYDDIHREPHVINAAIQTGNPTTHFITRCAKERLDERVSEERYCLDDGHEWVVYGSWRICWVPPGYIGSAPGSHCWAGSSLVMVGQDGILRRLTFLESLL